MKKVSFAEKRILIIVENLSVPFDRRVWREAVSLKNAGYDVTVISPKGSHTERESRIVLDGIRIVRYGAVSFGGGLVSYGFEYLHALAMITLLAWREFLSRAFDAVQICNPPDLLFLAVLPFKPLGVKILFDHHDLAPELYLSRSRGSGGLVFRLLLLLERLTFRVSDAVITTNRSFRDLAMSRGNVPPGRIFIVRNGPRDAQVRPFLESPGGGGSPGNGEPSNRTGPFLITYVGMMGPQDGVDGLLRILRRVIDRGNLGEVSIRLLGDGPEFGDLKRYARELGIDRYVEFVGRVEYDEVLRGIRDADLCVCPDPPTDMNSRSTLVKLVEYLSLGKPVVAYDLCESRVSAGDSAVFARPGDEEDFALKIETALLDPVLREGLARLARRRFVEELSWERSEEQLLAAYSFVFSEAAGPKRGKAGNAERERISKRERGRSMGRKERLGTRDGAGT
jgi:glycosyltransferase involved in cell wall biosynthesis